MKKYTSSIEFWIIIFFIVRLVGITNPPLETGHNWRQVTGLMVARNFIEVDAHIAYPRIDENNQDGKIIGMEFPLMNYMYFLLAKVFGYTHWYGRLINLIISSFALLYFYRLIMLFFSRRMAFASTIILAGSIWLSFSRKMMPDTFCISLMIIGLYFGVRYLQEKKIKYIILYIVLSTLAMLSKIPASIYLLLIALLIFRDRNDLKEKLYLVLASLIPVSATYYWYYIWNPKLAETYGNWYNIGKTFALGWAETIEHFSLVLKSFYFNAFNSYFFFGLFIAGIILMIIKREKKLIWFFSGMLLFFSVYIIKSGDIFSHHNYYIIPFVPVMALLAGYASSFIQKEWIFVLILVIGVGESVANQQHDFFIKKQEIYKMELEAIADSLTLKNDLIAINGNGNPQLIYLAHRKGWTCNNEQLEDSIFVDGLALQGCKYIFLNNHTSKAIINKKLIFRNKDFSVYDLTNDP